MTDKKTNEPGDSPVVALIIASYSESIEAFRGHLIAALQSHSIQVHVAAPGLEVGSSVRDRLVARGVCVHDLAMQRTGLSPVSDFSLLVRLVRLMFSIKPNISFSYTAKPVIYGLIAAWTSGVGRR